MKTRNYIGLLIISVLAGCGGSYSFRGLKPGLPKSKVVASWGQPAVVPRTLAIKDGTVMEIYQYERRNPRDIFTLYFRDDHLWYWDKRDWRGSSPSEYTPGKKGKKKKGK